MSEYCRNWGSHSGVCLDCGLLGCYTAQSSTKWCSNPGKHNLNVRKLTTKVRNTIHWNMILHSQNKHQERWWWLSSGILRHVVWYKFTIIWRWRQPWEPEISPSHKVLLSCLVFFNAIKFHRYCSQLWHWTVYQG
jgi:hypothetical protein